MYKALIIDDEKPVIMAITALIDWSVYHIQLPLYTAFDGEKGLEMMHQVDPQIVFVDMNMPVMDGTEFLKRASVDYPNAQYIVVSGYDEFKYAQTAIQNGAIDYLLKPIDGSDLKRAVERALSFLEAERTRASPLKDDKNEAICLNPQKAIQQIKSYIEGNYCSDIKIQYFSEKYFISREYLSKLFKENYGFGIYEYVLMLRMSKAKELLAHTEMQIQEISDLIGYSNNNYFSKAFKTYYGVSPSEYRKKTE